MSFLQLSCRGDVFARRDGVTRNNVSRLRIEAQGAGQS
jgi:hypothetical protein